MIAALLLTAALSRARAEAPVDLPLLPVHARLDGTSPGFCASQALKDGLASWAFMSVFRYGEYSPTTDLVIGCVPHEGGRVRIIVRDRDGAEVETFKSKVTDSRHEGVAFLVARRLAEGSKTIEAALVAYRANLRATAAQAGAQAVVAGDWTTAASELYRALESSADPAPLYFGLYVAHANLGHTLRARWYLLLFCEESGRRPDQLSAEQLAPLRALQWTGADDGFSSASLAEWDRLLAEGRGAQAMHLLKGVLERAPWTVEGYEALADAYGRLDWDPLEDGWRRRFKTARKAASRRRNHEKLLGITDPE